jgi:glycosyltransferase involved in cell wall biosynthesis
LQIAKELRLEVFVHARNYGYGGNQKTCYTEALKAGADIVVMLHPDYQYDPMLLPNVVAPIKAGAADVVLGSRLLAGDVIRQGMPWWKFLGNRFLTGIQNWVLGRKLTEYHTGYRAFSRRVLEAVPFLLNSDNFVFDQEVLVQAIHLGFRIKEVPVHSIFCRSVERELQSQRGLWFEYIGVAHPLSSASKRASDAETVRVLSGTVQEGRLTNSAVFMQPVRTWSFASPTLPV